MRRLKSKLLTDSQALKLSQKTNRAGKQVAFTNGTFDILHRGHVTYLEKARETGDLLIVGVNTDRSVKSYKSPNRPINPQEDRCHVLAALECVDAVVLFDEPTPLKLIKKIKPNILVKGADWKKEQIAGAKEVESWGGKICLIPLVKGRSTTHVLKKLGLE